MASVRGPAGDGGRTTTHDLHTTPYHLYTASEFVTTTHDLHTTSG